MSTYVLIPGAGGRAWYWHLVSSRLRDAGHTVVAPNLPSADPGARLGDYVAVVSAAIDETAGPHPHDLAVVGQSLGGLIAPIVAAERQANALVLVAPMIPRPGETGGEWWAATGQPEAAAVAARRDGRDPDGPFDPEAIFLHDVPATVIQAGADEPQDQTDGPLLDSWPLSEWPDIPTRVIAGRFDRLFPLEFVQRVARERLGIEPEIVDTGHLPALARPDDLTELLLA